jgi:hypothetical protein
MRLSSLIFAVMLVTITACNNTGEVTEETRGQIEPELLPADEYEPSGAILFKEALLAHCGNAYEGRVVAAPEDSDFIGKKLVMHVLSCEGDVVNIPFNVGDDRSRTWVLTFIDNRILLKHDHRHEDGTSDTVTMYGGMTANSGQSGIQVFPADEETRILIPEASSNVWWITIDDSTFTYNLRRLSTERVFTIAFDLKNPVEKPEPSWGW